MTEFTAKIFVGYSTDPATTGMMTAWMNVMTKEGWEPFQIDFATTQASSTSVAAAEILVVMVKYGDE